MEQILKSTQNKTLKTPNAQNIVNLEAENQIKVNRSRETKPEGRSENVNTEKKEQDQNKIKSPTPVPRKSIRSEISTIPENKRNEAQVELYDNQSRENNNLSDVNIQDNELQAMRASLFPFGMAQTPTIFLNNLLRFKRGYKINEQDILENLDAVLIGEAQSFIQEFKQVYLNEKYVEVIHNKIKCCNQKKNQEIHSFIIEMRQLFEKVEPLPSLEWQLKKVYENLRLEYKIYITRNSFKNFTELEIVEREWEAEMEKSRIKGQQIKIMENDGNDRYYTKERKEQDRNREQQHCPDYENNYERQNNCKRESQNMQYRPQFQPRYANNGTRYFYNNQNSQNTYPRTRDNNDFLNRTKFNYNRSFRYPNPNKCFGRKENQISEDSNRQQIEGIPK